MSAACGRSFEACSRAGDPQVAFGRPSRRRSRTSPGDGGTWHCVHRAPCTASPAGERERRRLPAAVPDHRATDRLRGNGTTTGLTRLLVGATGSEFRSRLRGFADSAVRRQGSSRGSGLVASPRKPARRPAFACDRWSRHSDLNRGPAVYEMWTLTVRWRLLLASTADWTDPRILCLPVVATQAQARRGQRRGQVVRDRRRPPRTRVFGGRSRTSQGATPPLNGIGQERLAPEPGGP
jgi:hypothetical protein